MTFRPAATRLRCNPGMLAISVTVLGALWVVGGCSVTSSGGETGSLVPASVQPTQGKDPSSATTPATIDMSSSVIGPVVAEIARVAGIPAEQVTIVSAEPVTFPDGGLGCPVSGMVYVQVQVDGYKIVAEAGGKTYDYRGTGPGKFRLCTTAGG